MTRREYLQTTGAGFGLLGWRGMLAGATRHHAAKAKRVVFLFLNGGPSQVDTFDPKPALDRYHGKPMPSPNLKTERRTGALLKSPFQFHRHGQSGLEMSEIFPKLGARADDLCIIRSMHTDRPFHETSLFVLNCGAPLPGRPSMGSWLTYGLGVENENLPGYIVLCPGLPVVGPQLWTSAFLPARHQGVHITNNERDPFKMIPFLRGASTLSDGQRRQIDLVGKLNRLALERPGADPHVESGIVAMETAFRMQKDAPEAFDVAREPESTRARYGDSDFGRGCLMALRLLERGVRMVQVYYGNSQPWDNHDDILIHRRLAQDADSPMAALIEDLKSRGLLQDTIVLIGGEFGRTPSVEVSGLVNVQNGRDHNNHGFSMVLAGGGIKGGMAYGSTDEFGFKAVDKPVHPHDLQATILHLMGIDHTRLTFRSGGRDYRLTDVEGTVIRDLFA